jgi:uncharacterized protein
MNMETNQDPWSKEAPAMIVLMVLIAAMIAAALMTGGFTIAAAVVYGLNPDEAMGLLATNPTPAVRSFFRASQGASHIFLFVVSSIGTIWALNRAYLLRRPYAGTQWARNWISYFNLDKAPSANVTFLGIALLLVIVPLVHYSYMLNKALPLADWMRTLESNTADAIKGLLIMDTPWEFIANLMVIAVLPAIGEELVFRGIVQPQLEKVTKKPWTAILITAVVFSAIHMQFEGFFPRLLLGIVLGWLYWQTKNLWVPILAHLFNNGIQVIGVYMFKSGLTSVDMEKDMDVPWYAALISVALVLGVGYLIQQICKSQQQESSAPGDAFKASDR